MLVLIISSSIPHSSIGVEKKAFHLIKQDISLIMLTISITVSTLISPTSYIVRRGSFIFQLDDFGRNDILNFFLEVRGSYLAGNIYYG